MDAIEFKKKYVNIVNLLNSKIAVGAYRGKEVWTKIETLMNRVSDGTLVLIDLRPVIWFDSAFCEPGFGPIFYALKEQRWPRKYVIFQMYSFLKPVFFRGILKHFGIKLSRKESESGFVSAGMYTKLIIDDKELIDFVGNLNVDEQTILDVVNNLKQVTSVQVVKETGLSAEVVVDALRSLAQKYFVVEHDEAGRVFYYSFYNYLKKEGIQ
jgi:hypothetical protein